MNVCRFGRAPRFHLSADWSRRLSVGPAWHAPTDDERAALVRDAEGTEADVLLFGLPRHLHQEWANLLDQVVGEAGALVGYDVFAGHVADLLAFKGLAVPPGAVLDLLVIAPGQPSVELTDLATGWRLWGAVNLGDQAAAVVFQDPQLATAAPLRLLLEPGEGFRLPDRALRVTGWTLDRQEPDLLLLVRCPDAAG